MPTAYCFKCRQKREMKDPKQVTLKNGRPATEGVCPVCGTKLYRIGKVLEAIGSLWRALPREIRVLQDVLNFFCLGSFNYLRPLRL